MNGYLCNEKEKWDCYKVHEFPDIAGLCLLSNIRNYCAFDFDEIPVSDDFCEKLASFGFITLDKVVMLHFVLVIVSHLAFYQLCSRMFNWLVLFWICLT